MEFAKYGFANECPGCESAQAGTKNRAHSENCRKRLEERMGADSDHKRRLADAKKRKLEDSNMKAEDADMGDAKQMPMVKIEWSSLW